MTSDWTERLHGASATGSIAHAPVFALGFRPFFILAGSAAVLLVPAWVAVLSGVLPPPGGPLAGVPWHAHEMVYGFALAIVTGFLLTATPNWTNTPALTGWPILGLAGLWLAGRLTLALPAHAPWWAVAVSDASFLGVVAVAIGVPIFRSRDRRNIGLPFVLLSLAALDLLSHLGFAGALGVDPMAPLRVAVHLIVLLMVVVGGRVTPAFTRNALGPGANVRSVNHLDRVAVTSAVVVAVVAGLPSVPAVVRGATFAIAAIANGARMRGWASARAARIPLLAILHLGYAWLVLGFALGGVASLRPDLVPSSLALHAFTAGAIGTYGLGMMVRVSLGHTGRALEVGPTITIAFAAVVLSGVVRVGAGLLGVGTAPAALHIIAGLWSLAFALFLVVYVPILLRPRPDGRPG